MKESYKGKLLNAEYIGENGFYLGIHQYLDSTDLDYVIKIFNTIFQKM